MARKTGHEPHHQRFQFKADTLESDAEGRTFEGLLSTWELDLGGDIVHRGAFKRTLHHWRTEGRIVPLLDSHDHHSTVTKAVGKLLEAEERDEGLWTRWGMVPDDSHADAVLKRVSGGFVDGLSIGYRPVKIERPTEAEKRAGVWRHLKEVHLREGSVVVFPMNEESRVDAESVKTELAELAVEVAVDASNLLEAVRLLDLKRRETDLADHERDELHKLEAALGDSETGLSPDDPRRLAMAHRLRGLKLRGLTTPR